MSPERRKQVEELFGRAAGPAEGAAGGASPRDSRPKAVAVLPFRTLNAPAGAETGEFLGVGLADALITRLSNARGVTVRPTSSVMRFAREEADPVAAGRQLAADYVVDGHLLRAGGRVRVTVQLIGVERGAPLWAARFDESHADILALHDSLSEQVARELIPRLAGEEPAAAAPARRGTRNPAAYEAYMRGRLHWNSMAEEGFAKAIVHYNEAVALDPSYAAAHSGIADYHNWLGVLGVLPPRECFRAAKEAAARAAALDPSSAEAYAALGFACHAQCEWRAAERHFKRALELKPNHAGAHQWYGFLLASLRRFGEAVTECRRAQEIAHNSPALRQGFAWVFYQSRRYEESHALNQEVLAAEPNFAFTLYTESRVLSMLGRHGEAVEAARRACDVTGASPTFLGQLGYACALAGLEAEARSVLARLGELARTRYVSAFQTALIHAALGERDEALARLSESIEQREAWLCWIRTEPGLDPLRTDPRFQTVFERVLHQESAPAPQAADVKEEVASPAATEVDESEAVVGVSDAGARRVSQRRPAGRGHSTLHRVGLVVLGALLATLAALAALIYVAPWEDGGVDSVAVLPFVNVNSDPEVEYIADGLTEHLINQLARLPPVRVMARTTAFTYKGREVDARRAGREMGVGAVLVGRVSRRGEVLAIEAELVRVGDGSRLWGAAYARGMSELPSIEQEMAVELLSSLRPRLSGEERRRLARGATRDAGAYQLYLQGEYHRNRATPEDLRRAVEFFERSAARDPSNALAHAGLALSYRSLPAYGLMLPRDAYPRAKAAAERALSIDPTLAGAHVPLAAIKFVYEWKFAEAEAQYREALRLNPNHAEAHFAYANFLTAMERFDEAMREYEAAESLDPFSVNIADGVVWSLFVSGRHEEALARCRRNLERDPRHAQTYLHMGEIYTAQGRYQEAADALQKARELSNQTLVEIAFGHLYAVSGRREEALRIARDYEERVRAGRASPFLLAVIYAGLDDKDAAFAWLERSFEERSNWMALLKVGRRLAPLQGDPRFRRLVERVGFPAPNKS